MQRLRVAQCEIDRFRSSSIFLRRLADYGNTISRTKMTVLSALKRNKISLENRYANFRFRILHFPRSRELNSVNKSALCKCKNSVIILFGRAHHNILFYPEAINISASFAGAVVTKAQACYSRENGTVCV